MTTNLIFKRQVTKGDELTTVTRIVSVDIPMIEPGEGWVLSGHSDIIEVMNNISVCSLPDSKIPETSVEPPSDTKTDISEISTFESAVMGTARLVRSKGSIKIAARRGKKGYNQTSPNSVCISDALKCEFFRHCRTYHGNIGIYEFKLTDTVPYEHWNEILDKEYQFQKNSFIRKQEK